MTTPTPPIANPNETIIFGAEADTGESCAFPIQQIQSRWEPTERTSMAQTPGVDGAIDTMGLRLPERGPGRAEVSALFTAEDGPGLDGTIGYVDRVTSKPIKLWRVTPNGDLQWARARRLTPPTEIVTVDTLGLSCYQVRQYQFSVPGGIWYSATKEEANYYGGALYGDVFYGVDAAYQVTLSGTLAAGSIVHPGNFHQRALQGTITCGSGTITGLRVQNLTTGQDFTIGGTITAGESYVIDTMQNTLKKGTVDYYPPTWGATHREGFLMMAAGLNVLQFSQAGSMDGTIVLSFYSAY